MPISRRARSSLLVVVLTFLSLTPRAMAWGNKEHIQLTRLAATQLLADPATPPAMKQWLRDNTPGELTIDVERRYFLNQRIGLIPRNVDGLPYWATMPDMNVFTDRPDSKVDPYGVHERLLHYIDLEFFIPDETKRNYRHDLSGKPKLEDVPRDMTDPRYQRAGVLPFRVEECYRKLVESLRAGRLADKPGQYPRDEHGVKWAGYLAHYVEDNTQPQHATVDYKSQQYFADKRKAPNVHAEVEYMMNDDDEDDHLALREEFWTHFVAALDKADDPVTTDDLWAGTIEVALRSYDALPLIGLAAMHAAGQGGTPDDPQGPAGEFSTEKFFRFTGDVRGEKMSVSEMKARQQAWAIKRVARLWRKAWDEAGP
jgi:hypothetical protein